MSHVETVALAVSVQRVFVVPADLARTTAYFCDFARVLSHLPHLRLITAHAANQYRIRYSATEAGVLHVTIFSDVQTHYDEANRTFHVIPQAGIPPVKPEAAFNSITSQGYYTRRRELDWMPKAIVKRLAEDVVRRRLCEITAAFINCSLAEL
jgi:hypothetical protein